MNRLKILLVVTLVGVAALLGFYYFRAPSNEVSTIRLPIPVVDAAFAPYYLAEDRGLFRDAGVDVAIKPGGPELNPVQTVASGVDQFGVLGGLELLVRARSQGLPLVAVMQLHKDGNFVVLVSKKGSGITRLEDVEGRSVGFFPGHISTDVLRALFAKNDVNVREVNVGFDYSQLIADQIPVQWAFSTTAGLTLPARGIELDVINPADYGITTQGHILVTTEEMIREHPDVVQRVVSAVLSGAEVAARDARAATAATTQRDPQLPQSVAAAQSQIYAAAIRRNTQIGEVHLPDLAAARGHLQYTGVSPDLDLTGAYTNRFVEAHYRQAADASRANGR